ncbi:MAG: D-alanyl-D-alanine carboxypeptidase [Clostridia bacterium]|nr:D-alanyl-D-alanine carboxypeptidase [Clostridia bacterium]
MRQISRFFAAILAVTLVMMNLLCLTVGADDKKEDALPVIENCASYYLYNFENDRVLMEGGMDTPVYPASTVKLMTGILAVETLGEDLDRRITVTSDMLKTAAGNRIGLVAGEEVSVKDMLYATLEGGANDAALVLACTVAGSVEEFVSMMNTKASLLGAYNTRYTNPTGIHNDAMVTTAADTAIIAKYAAGIPLITEITSAPKYVMDKTNMKDFRNIYNRNCLISKFYDTYEKAYRYERATGMNAGSTGMAGNVVVATAVNTDGDLTYLAIAMGASGDEKKNYAYEAVTAMFEYAFSAWGYIDVLDESRMLAEVPVSLSSAVDHVTLFPKEELRVYLPTSTDVESEIEYSCTALYESMAAPIQKGDVAGAVTVLYKGEVIGSSDLITNIDVERSELLYTLAQIEEFTKSKFFIGTVVSAVLLTVAYVLVNARVARKPRGF